MIFDPSQELHLFPVASWLDSKRRDLLPMEKCLAPALCRIASITALSSSVVHVLDHFALDDDCRGPARSSDTSRYHGLEQWIESYRQSDRPGRSRPVAADILAEMSDIDRRHGRLDVAIRLCEQSRTEGAADVDWIEAQVQAVSGARRHARRLLERFARSRSLCFNERVKNQTHRRLPATMAASS
jgi:hypothetical protein